MLRYLIVIVGLYDHFNDGRVGFKRAGCQGVKVFRDLTTLQLVLNCMDSLYLEGGHVYLVSSVVQVFLRRFVREANRTVVVVAHLPTGMDRAFFAGTIRYRVRRLGRSFSQVKENGVDSPCHTVLVVNPRAMLILFHSHGNDFDHGRNVLVVFRVRVNSARRRRYHPLVGLALIRFFVRRIDAFLRVLSSYLVALNGNVTQQLIFHVKCFNRGERSREDSSVLNVQVTRRANRIRRNGSARDRNLTFRIIRMFHVVLASVRSICLERGSVAVLSGLVNVEPIKEQAKVLYVIRRVMTNNALSNLCKLHVIAHRISMVGRATQMVINATRRIMSAIRTVFRVVRVLCNNFDQGLYAKFGVGPIVTAKNNRTSRRPRRRVFWYFRYISLL